MVIKVLAVILLLLLMLAAYIQIGWPTPPQGPHQMTCREYIDLRNEYDKQHDINRTWAESYSKICDGK